MANTAGQIYALIGLVCLALQVLPLDFLPRGGTLAPALVSCGWLHSAVVVAIGSAFEAGQWL